MTATILAAAALALSVISLWIAGRREQRRFLRDTNLSVMIEFMQASFDGSIQLAWKHRNGADASPDYLAGLTEQWETAASNKLRALTKLRLTAPRGVIRAAHELHEYEQKFHEIVFDESKPNIGHDEYKEMKKVQNEMREALIAAARTGLRVSRPHWIGHTHGKAGIVNRPALDSGASATPEAT